MFGLFSSNHDAELKNELHVLCEEWFEKQIGHLPSDELPPPEQIEQDISEMRDDVFQKLSHLLKNSNAIRRGKPDDAANEAALTNLASQYSGHETTTPIFAALALSKRGTEPYRGSWPLCTIRLIAEAWVKESTSA